MRNSSLPSPLLAALLAGIIAWLTLEISATGLVNSRYSFVVLTLLLLGYLFLEVVRLRQVHPERWLVNPVVLCSLITFALSHGTTNFIYFAPASQLELVSLIPEVSPAMVKVMGLALLAAMALWLGYWSPVAAHWTGPEMVRNFKKRLLPASNALRSFTLPALLVVAVLARVVQINLGVFGYSSNYDRLIELGSITQYLSMASGFGSMALVLACLQFYGQPSSAGNRMWLVGILSVELVFGLLSGFKSAIVMPFLIVAVCQYICVGRLSKYWPLLAVAGVFLGFTIIEPFRAERNRDLGFSGTSILEIASTIFSSGGNTADAVAETAPVVLSVASRLNYTYIASFGIDFADENPILPDGSPEFLQNIIRAPVHAWIPRFVWESKPLGNLGLWYNQVVLEKDHFSSTAMGPFAYLYFAGGSFLVFIGFVFIGIVQRCLFFLLQPRSSAAGAVIFVAILSSVTNIDSAFDGLIITLCRDLPMAMWLQFFLFKRQADCSVGAVAEDLGGGPALTSRAFIRSSPPSPEGPLS